MSQNSHPLQKGHRDGGLHSLGFGSKGLVDFWFSPPAMSWVLRHPESAQVHKFSSTQFTLLGSFDEDKALICKVSYEEENLQGTGIKEVTFKDVVLLQDPCSKACKVSLEKSLTELGWELCYVWLVEQTKLCWAARAARHCEDSDVFPNAAGSGIWFR